jgi:hypothetical protein
MQLRSIFPMSNPPSQPILNGMTSSEITIRPAYADDQMALQRLASLDSAASVPSHPLLVAEVDGELRVALSLHDGSAIADPFYPTSAILGLLRVHARAEMGRERGWRAPRATGFFVPGMRTGRRTPVWSR